MDDKIVEAVRRAIAAEMNWSGPIASTKVATAALSAARPMIEAAWRDGWRECKARLTDDEAFCLTDDVEEDAWGDSKTAAAIRALGDGGEP